MHLKSWFIFIVLLYSRLGYSHNSKGTTYLLVVRDSFEIRFSLPDKFSVMFFKVNHFSGLKMDSAFTARDNWKEFKFPGAGVGYYPDGATKDIRYGADFHTQGNYYTFFMNGQMHEITPFRNDTIDGLYVKYNEKGGLVEQIDYRNGLLDGREIIFDFKGRIFFETNFKKGKRHGERKSYLYRNGNLTKTEIYSNNKKEGITTRYYRSGKIYSTQTYKNDSANGDMTWFYRSGSVRQKITYKNDKADGEFIHYNRFHRIKNSSVYANGTLLQKKYYRFGKLIKTEQVTPKNSP